MVSAVIRNGPYDDDGDASAGRKATSNDHTAPLLQNDFGSSSNFYEGLHLNPHPESGSSSSVTFSPAHRGPLLGMSMSSVQHGFVAGNTTASRRSAAVAAAAAVATAAAIGRQSHSPLMNHRSGVSPMSSLSRCLFLTPNILCKIAEGSMPQEPRDSDEEMGDSDLFNWW